MTKKMYVKRETVPLPNERVVLPVYQTKCSLPNFLVQVKFCVRIIGQSQQVSLQIFV